MEKELKAVTASVDPGFLSKVDRFFDGSPTTVFGELLQNSRRAGAESVEIRIKDAEGGARVTYRDDGPGVPDLESLLRLGYSGWSEETRSKEDPAGAGFFSLSLFPSVQVRTAGWSAVIDREVFSGVAKALPARSNAEGFEAEWFWPDAGPTTLASRAADAALYSGIDRVRVDGPSWDCVYPKKDFLEKSKLIDEYPDQGFRVGVGTGGRFGTTSYNVLEFNFHGVRFDTPTPHGWPSIHLSSYVVRIDVEDVSELELVLPARNAFRHTAALTRVLEKAETAVYRYLAQEMYGEHKLAFNYYDRARKLGVDIGVPKAVLLLRLLHSGRETTVSVNPDKGLVLSNILPLDSSANLQFASLVGWIDFEFYDCCKQYEGYEWYDRLRKVEKATLVVDGKLIDFKESERLVADSETPPFVPADKLEIAVETSDGEKFAFEVQYALGADHCMSWFDESDFLMFYKRGLDADVVAEMEDLAVDAIFSPSDEWDSDSHETQRDNFLETFREVAVEYLGSKIDSVREALSAWLGKLPMWSLTGYEWTVSGVGSKAKIVKLEEAKEKDDGEKNQA